MPSPQSKPKAKAATVDGYLAALPDDQRAALQRLRKIIHAAVPGAQERISYGMPGFRVDGRFFVWMGAAAKHCALYGLAETHQGELKDYDTSGRGTLRFALDEPLPAALVRKLVKARLATLAAKAGHVGRRKK
jgi:uncharacterized protein YdhG (YjbR/CyaY superfamily)